MKMISLLFVLLCTLSGCGIFHDNTETVISLKEEKKSEQINGGSKEETPLVKKKETRPKMYSFDYAAIKAKWIEKENDQFILRYQEGTEAEKHIERIMKEFNKQCQYLVDTFGSPPTKIKIYVHPFYDTSGYLGLAFPSKHILHVGYEGTFEDDIQSTGTHELTHIYSRNWSNSPNIVLTEGIAVYYASLYTKEDVDSRARIETTLEQVPILTLSKIYTNQWDSNYGYSYNVAGSFVKYLVQTYGEEKFEQMYKDRLIDFEVGFEEVYQKKLKDVEQDWLKQLHKRSE